VAHAFHQTKFAQTATRWNTQILSPPKPAEYNPRVLLISLFINNSVMKEFQNTTTKINYDDDDDDDNDNGIALITLQRQRRRLLRHSDFQPNYQRTHHNANKHRSITTTTTTTTTTTALL